MATSSKTALMDKAPLMDVAPIKTGQYIAPYAGAGANMSRAPLMDMAPNMNTNAGAVYGGPVISTAAPAQQQIAAQTAKVNQVSNSQVLRQPTVASPVNAQGLTLAQMVAQANGQVTPQGTLPTQQQMSPYVNAQGLTVAQMVAQANGLQPGGVNATAPQTLNAQGQQVNAQGLTAEQMTAAAGGTQTPPAPTTATTPTPATATPGAAGTTPPSAAPPAATTPAAPAAPGSNQAAVQQAQAQFDADYNRVQAARESDLQTFLSKADQIRNGTYPLSADEQSQIDSITTDFQSQVADQQKANADYLTSVKLSGIMSGRSMYTPDANFGNVHSVISNGVRAISDINRKMASAVTEAKVAIAKQDYAMLNDSYDKIIANEDARSKAIEHTYNHTKDALDAVQKDHENQMADKKFNFEVEQEKAKQAHEATADSQKAIYDMYSKYPDAGIDPLTDTLVGAAAKAKASASFANEQQQKFTDSISEYNLYSQQERSAGREPLTFLGYVAEKTLATSKASESSNDGPKIVKVNGVDSIWNASTGQYESAPASMVANQAAIAAAGDQIDRIDRVLSEPGLESSVGANVWGRFNPLNVVTGAKDNFLADVTQVLNKETLDALIAVKGQGATLGALSDSEGKLLAASASKLGALALHDDKNDRTRITGFRGSPKDFKEEMGRLKEHATNMRDIAQGINVNDTDYKSLRSDPDLKGKSDKELWDAVEAERNNLGKTGEGSGSANAQMTTALTSIPTDKKWGEGTRKTNVGECGALVNDVTGLHMGDSLESKIKVTDPSISSRNASVGDVFVQSVKNDPNGHGHTGIINSIGSDAQGRFAYVTEANYHLNGQTTHTRKIYLDDPLIKGFAKPKKFSVTA